MGCSMSGRNAPPILGSAPVQQLGVQLRSIQRARDEPFTLLALRGVPEKSEKGAATDGVRTREVVKPADLKSAPLNHSGTVA